jgi:hypothetical protein
MKSERELMYEKMQSERLIILERKAIQLEQETFLLRKSWEFYRTAVVIIVIILMLIGIKIRF